MAKKFHQARNKLIGFKMNKPKAQQRNSVLTTGVGKTTIEFSL